MNKTKQLIISMIMISFLTIPEMTAQTTDPLKLNAQVFTENTLLYPTGQNIKYRAFENIFYVANIADSVYQTLNIYIPESAYTKNTKVPIFLKTNIGGYMASKASSPSSSDATGRALLEGYVVVIPGSRGSNSTITDADGNTVWTGRAPAGIVDLKATIRYLRYNKDRISGNTEMIITDGTSAGGAMSALLGATGNNPAYEPYLEALGAAKEHDDVFAAVCYCPITALDHADMAYEWLYQSVNKDIRGISDTQVNVSKELAAQFPAYINSLGLKRVDGTPLTESNYMDYVKSFLIQSAQRARNEGVDIPDSIGIKFNNPNKIVQGDIRGMQKMNNTPPPMGIQPSSRNRPGGFPMSKGEIVTDIDLDVYFNYINSQRRLKTPPAFDALGVAGATASAENNVFGNTEGSSTNFTNYSLHKSTGNSSLNLDDSLLERVYIMNPMNFIGDGVSKTAPNWYIRHGALDRDTSFPVPVNLYTKLMNNGYSVDFFLPWNRNHSGDYNLDDLFTWIKTIVDSDEKL